MTVSHLEIIENDLSQRSSSHKRRGSLRAPLTSPPSDPFLDSGKGAASYDRPLTANLINSTLPMGSEILQYKLIKTFE